MELAALWGAFTGTLGLLLSLYLASRNTRPNVLISWEPYTTEPSFGVRSGHTAVFRVVNERPAPFIVSSLTLELANGETLDPSIALAHPPRVPTTLRQGEYIEGILQPSSVLGLLGERQTFVRVHVRLAGSKRNWFSEYWTVHEK